MAEEEEVKDIKEVDKPSEIRSRLRQFRVKDHQQDQQDQKQQTEEEEFTKIREEEYDKMSEMGPHCVHQVWIQGLEHFKETQPDFYKFSLTLKEHYHDYYYKLWGEKDALPLIEAYSPELLTAYRAAPNYPSKSDIIRYVVLRRFGGLYVDTDYESFKRCDYLFDDEKIDLCIVAMNLTKNKLLFGNYKYNNAWIFARPGCIYLKYMLDRIAQHPFSEKLYSKFQYTWEITGPKGITDLEKQYQLAKKDNVRVFDHNMIEVGDFSNIEVTFHTRDQVLDQFPFAVGIHRMHGSWIQNATGLKNTFGRFYTWVTSWSDFIHIGLLVVPIILLIVVLTSWRIHKYRQNKKSLLAKR